MKTTQKSMANVPEVLISNDRVIALQSHDAIPLGCRPATPREIAKSFIHDPEFRAHLREEGWAWTLQSGLGSSGYHRIGRDGEFQKVDFRTYTSLPVEERSQHFSGNGTVAVCFNGGTDEHLLVDAGFRSSDFARVAYVKIEDEAHQDVNLRTMKRNLDGTTEPAIADSLPTA